MQSLPIDIAQLAGIFATIGTLYSCIVAVNRKLVRPMREFYADAASTNKLVKEQLSMNGGQSLRDVVFRLESLQHRQRADLQAYFSLLTANNVAMWEADERGAYTWVNGLYKAWTGTGDEDLLGEAWLGSVLHSDRALILQGWQEAIRDKRDFESYHRMLDAEGKAFWVHSYAVVRRLQGNSYGYVGRIERHKEAVERPLIC